MCLILQRAYNTPVVLFMWILLIAYRAYLYEAHYLSPYGHIFIMQLLCKHLFVILLSPGGHS